MPEDSLEILRQISLKLDQVIAVLRIENAAVIARLASDLRNDAAARRILEISDGSLSYSSICNRVAEETGMSEVTVKRRIADMKQAGILTTVRHGKEVRYVNSGLVEVI